MTDFCDWASRQPDRPVKALATQRPTMVVKTGLIDEERTISGLLPVARMARPSFVFKNRPRRTATRITAMAATTSLNCPAKAVPANRSFIFVKTVTVLFILRTEELPMMAMLIE